MEISTHAPRTGSDAERFEIKADAEEFQPTLPHGERLAPLKGFKALCNFNPRSPHGERRRWSTNKHGQFIISTHAPRTGSDKNVKQSCEEVSISTHAPRTGSDPCKGHCAAKSSHFNPRSPHGERQHPFPRSCPCPYFNPRSPHGERRCRGRCAAMSSHFNPRSPHGERPFPSG